MYAFPSVKLPPKAIEEREMLKTLAETVIFGALVVKNHVKRPQMLLGRCWGFPLAKMAK